MRHSGIPLRQEAGTSPSPTRDQDNAVPTKQTPPPPHNSPIFLAVLVVAAVIARDNPAAFRELVVLVHSVSVAVGIAGREPR